MENKLLTRSFGGNVTPETNGRKVCGYAIRFNEPSQNIGFIETIDRSAVTQDLINNSDVYCRLNHRDDVVLARCRYGVGSLKLELREDGLYYEFDSPNTIWGDELLEHIKRGEISTSSFAFYISGDDKAQRWYKEDGQLKRTIYKIEYLADVSPTFEGAYLSTSCGIRSKEAENALSEIEKEEIRNAETLNKLDAKLAEIEKIFD